MRLAEIVPRLRTLSPSGCSVNSAIFINYRVGADHDASVAKTVKLR